MGVNHLRWRRSGCLSPLVASSLVILALVVNLPSAKSGKCAKIRKIESLQLSCGFSSSAKRKVLRYNYS